MKKRILYIIGALLLSGGSFSSCDSFFKDGSNSIYAPDDIFTDITNARMAVYGVYNMASNAWSKRVSGYFCFDDDLCVNNVTAATSGNNILLGRYSLTAGNGELHNWHFAMVRGVVRGSIVIDELLKSPLINHSDPEIKREAERLLGETYLMRAVQMAEVVKIWGDVPYTPAAPVPGDNFEAPKTDRDTIYGQLILDLEKAIELLPWHDEPWVGKDERATKGSALAFMARVCLLTGGYSLRPGATPADFGTMKRRDNYLYYYSIAQKHLKTLIESGKHGLNPSFYNEFKGMCELRFDKDNSHESLLEIAWAGGSSAISGEVGSHMGTKIHASSRYGVGNGAINITPNYYFMFDPVRDSRFNVIVAPYEIDANNNKIHKTLTTMYPGKIRRDWRVPLLPGTNQYTDINWPLIRYSDALLMYAEVENELNNGPTPAAKDALEKVRKRAYAGYENEIPATPTTKEEFFEAIVTERALELASEGNRKYDLIRWNRLGSYLAQVKADAIKIRDGVAPYENVPDYLWYKYDAVNDALITSFTQPTLVEQGETVNDPSYTRVDWRVAINDSFLANLATNYFKPGQSEIYPLATATLAANPALVQDYGY